MSHPHSELFQQASEAQRYLESNLPSELQKPRFAIICGSGLGGLADTVDEKNKAEFQYGDIPHFPMSTVHGHAGKLVFGTLGNDVPGVLMVGRLHYYEGHAIDRITFPVRVFKLLGIEMIIVTNAAGGLNETYSVGDIMMLNDHLSLGSLAGISPLRGPNPEEFGFRFPPLSDAYDLELRRYAHKAWSKTVSAGSSRRLHEGVYVMCGGPAYETRAECRLLRLIGADTVGMSTVPEVVTARHSGLRVLALSLVTNKTLLEPAPRGDQADLQDLSSEELTKVLEAGKANHEEVLEEGRLAAFDMQKLIRQTIHDIFAS